MSLYQRAKAIADHYDKYSSFITNNYFAILIKGMDEHNLSEADKRVLQDIIDANERTNEAKHKKVSHRK